MWVITEKQMNHIVGSILQQREYRAFKILTKEDEFKKIPKEELKDNIQIFANKVADIRLSEAVLLEFIRQCIRDPEILKKAKVDILVRRIENDIN